LTASLTFEAPSKNRQTSAATCWLKLRAGRAGFRSSLRK